jgi:hypothetical protein
MPISSPPEDVTAATVRKGKYASHLLRGSSLADSSSFFRNSRSSLIPIAIGKSPINPIRLLGTTRRIVKCNPYYNKILISIPYLRKISISLTSSAAILLLLLLISPQLFNLLPIQASESNSASMQTAAPADGTVCPSSTVAKIVFDAEGTYSPPYREFTITSGSFQIYSDAGGNFTTLYSGRIDGAAFIPTRAGWSLELNGGLEGVYNNTTCVPKGSYQIQIVTPCGNPAPITVNLENKLHLGDFNGRVGCDPSPPQSMAGNHTR